jgi:hypothetical protein
MECESFETPMGAVAVAMQIVTGLRPLGMFWQAAAPGEEKEI